MATPSSTQTGNFSSGVGVSFTIPTSIRCALFVLTIDVVTSITWGSQHLTGPLQVINPGKAETGDLWYLVNATSGSNSLTFNTLGGASGSYGCIAFNDVDITATYPLNYVTNDTPGTTNGIAITIGTSFSNSYILEFTGGSNALAPVAHSGQTTIPTQKNLWSYKLAPSPGSYTMGWTDSSHSGYWCEGAFEIKDGSALSSSVIANIMNGAMRTSSINGKSELIRYMSETMRINAGFNLVRTVTASIMNAAERFASLTNRGWKSVIVHLTSWTKQNRGE